jgi:hypothetical protein
VEPNLPAGHELKLSSDGWPERAPSGTVSRTPAGRCHRARLCLVGPVVEHLIDVSAHARGRDWRPADAQHDMRFHTQA